jgi:7-cyano-7-deazaguanine reductase
MTLPTAPGELTVLGATVQHPIAYVECFPAPQGCSRVRLLSDEVASICPVTHQPDLSRVVIDYVPGEFCVESKSLKLYLWSFRDRAIFAEALSAEIAAEIMRAATPQRVTVTVTQGVRGGIVVETESTLGH